MAYSTLVSVKSTIDEIIHHDRYSISSNGKEHILSLNKHVISFLSFLENFPEKASDLEARIRDAAMEAEDIIELFMLKHIHHKWISKLGGAGFEFKLQKVRDEMDSIAREVVEVNHSNITIKDAKVDDYVRASTSSTSSSSQVAKAGKIDTVGLYEDLIQVMDRLCGYPRQLQFIPITGMGGIGKTTLARNAYDDPLIMEHFEIRAWVTISQDYSEGRILSELLDAMKEFSPQISEESNSEKAEKVHKTLVGRRFLIVMDDMWSTNVLDHVKKFFPDDDNGSRILLTTRLADIAAYANSSKHEMHLMDADQSWNLLRQKVFKHQDRIPRELESIGREIARSCGGLPLAMVVVAGVLSTESMTVTSWTEIARNLRSTLGTTDGQIETILSLSYNHLPHYLRPCFLYMGGFPEDHEIKVMNLIKLWIAEGFVKQVAFKSIEENAQEYMEDLIKRSLVVVSKSKSNGKMKSCSLHDLVRDLCIKLSKEEKFFVHVESKLMKSMMDERRISMSHLDLHTCANDLNSKIRTMMFFGRAFASFGSFRLLRVLDVIRIQYSVDVIIHQIFELFHLRYLAFCYSGRVPRSISNLQSLQTLVIKGYSYIGSVSLPCEIWNMPQLRHLILDSYGDLADPNGAIATLKNLQTLVTVRDLSFTLTILNMVPNLKKLSVIFSYRFGELLFDNLVHLRHLEKLKLQVSTSMFFHQKAFPDLVVPSWLKKLTLIGWGRKKPYINVTGPFPSLEVLKLRKFDFKQQEWSSSSDQDFPKLRYLLIQKSNLKQWNSECCHFPVLEQLLVHSCWSLFEIPDDFGEIPTLKLIEVKNCRTSLASHVKQMREEQLNYGDDVFQVRCVESGLEEP